MVVARIGAIETIGAYRIGQHNDGGENKEANSMVLVNMLKLYAGWWRSRDSMAKYSMPLRIIES
jgi:hypothetical protein